MTTSKRAAPAAKKPTKTRAKAVSLGRKAVDAVEEKQELARTGKKAPKRKTTPKKKGLTLQQHRFVEGMMVEKTARKAALYAGYTEDSAGVMATLNMQKPQILEAIAARRAEVAKYVNITAHDILMELEDNRQVALDAPTPQVAAAVTATMGKAKILGFLVDRVDHTTKGDKVQAGMGHFYGEGDDAIDVTPNA